MPELPEVETVARSLRPFLVGRVIAEVDVLWPRSLVDLDPETFASQVTGQTVVGVERRGKWIVLRFGGGGALLIHLRMSGQLILDSYVCPDDPHTRVRLLLDDGRRLYFSDTRKFGRLWLVNDPERVLADLGPEPLAAEFTVGRFAAMLATRRRRLKPLLLDQRFVAGLGNIYVDEALWRARIHPVRRADSLSEAEIERLYRSIRELLDAAVRRGGTTLRDARYRSSDGRAGEFAVELAVYGRDGEGCPRCGHPISRIVVGQRGTHLCPVCQPAPSDA
ncbi:MAG: bifunctional DNA-formamidopyrimidine glycosylase/DNA-(apurinic or apyrimidinic site) lyase [Chloroflexi bacterium]|nr:bifunctional DNA-formamidopyrimidine glycosylase/DNA-(apurinic or apyrimidinic site) lyase [Chloroflexota bacterium]